MNKQPDAKQMHRALKRIVVPYLREQGFTGTYPHFRREREQCFELLSIQFSRQGGGEYAISLGVSPLTGISTTKGMIDPRKATALDAIHNGTLCRLNPRGPYDHWFVYQPLDDIHYGGYTDAITLVPEEGHESCEQLARLTLAMMQSRLEDIYRGLTTRLIG